MIFETVAYLMALVLTLALIGMTVNLVAVLIALAEVLEITHIHKWVNKIKKEPKP